MNAVGIALVWCVVQVTLIALAAAALYLVVRWLRPAAAATVVLAGGEERGTWLVEANAVSDRTFAYAVRLAREPGPRALGRLMLTQEAVTGALAHPAWFERLHRRQPFDGAAAEGWRLQLAWS